ncbi:MULTISPECIES: 2-oxo-4-hydroxy-4-carboxy-5-ureidoimidazoline decarboxylase [Cupriavidus]|uniref:2-oxo-4-hydroxy-4-carboxy-5-ureidoimidazoline decarboxylase n=1 Tax=Cupriavidus nantongensis TaxID=1796606 RepID=A0A142JU04_9BURK|nr:MULTISPECIES: 2-oxo-4-hydroxy-4-carboxy-5-ureidoimidazoline decarboxylase [Cupriavidus]AMR81566.1 OHCU decarboxylase [Cupriavidus nantongensis]MCO4889455.1 2-oxo-4-hydroxy-4-carboxy-5-ureidoimidazoline decarboxylase [Cupriavidus sp. WGtm5]MEC3766125.1 2-oxo-4-hydroxy-4-carboxy-5-ureidoimidazoline decarboxylase [Cupriavidus sp. SS-3]ULX51264.1 OHCU decarboxylase [Cupriavidus taiwanensis]
MSHPLDLASVNALDEAAFAEAFGSVFEHFPQAAAGAWAQRPFASVAALHGAMMDVVRKLDAPRQCDFLNLHPQLSARNIRAGTMTADSNAEQKSAGLDAMSVQQEAALDQLNADYQARHGFPFIICVRHYTREGIFAAFERRIGRSTQQELDEALAQIAAITRGRLAARLAG